MDVDAPAASSEPPLSASILNNIFNALPEHAAPDNQGDSTPYLALFGSFARSVGLSPTTIAALDALARGQHAHVGDALIGCQFFPEYGCVLMHLTSLGCATEPTTRLHLLGLDGWTFGISGHQFAATAGAPAELFAGAIPAAELSGFLTAVFEKLEEVKKRTAEKRSAADGKQGHQRTPAMILCILEEVYLDKAIEQLPRGGLTDVGRHTGGLRRATAWPLAASVIRALIEQLGVSSMDVNEHTFESLIPLWELWLAELVLDATEAGQRIVGLGATAHALHSSVRRAVAQVEDGHLLSDDYESRVAAVRSRIAAWQSGEMRSAAAAYALPPLVLTDQGIDAHLPRLPLLRMPPPPDAGMKAIDLTKARARAFTNLGWLPLPPGDDAHVSAFASWMRVERIAAADKLPRMASHLRAEAAERWIFTAAVTLLPQARVPETSDDVEGAIQSLEAVLLAYRAGIEHAMRLNADGSGRLLTELRSRETLACWAVTCLADRLACVAFPLLKNYHMALNFADLRHLSLSDGLAHAALQAVCAYLRLRTSDGDMGRPVFSLLPPDKTIEVATQIGGQITAITQAWSAEQTHAAGRRDAHWAEVQKKQALARDLRARLRAANADVADAEQKHSRAPRGSNTRYSSYEDRQAYYARDALYDELQQFRSVVSDLDSQLETALKPPAPVVQPLASDQGSALAVLFFLYMPPTLRMLSQLSFEAQAALLPRPLSEDDATKLGVSCPSLDWKSHHHMFQAYEFYTPSPPVRDTTMGVVKLKSRFMPPDKNSWPTSVDDMTIPSHGVWHPDGPLCLYWQGRDPWCPLPRERMREFYTPQLPESSGLLQWTLPVDDRVATPATRGNVAIAKQVDRPDWLSKPQFLAFSTARSYGHLQLRKLACALRDRSLPLAHAATQVLIRAALHQLGPLRVLSGGERTFLTWKADITNGDLLDVLHNEVAGLTDEIADRISDHASLLALLDVLAYLRAWEPASQRLADLRARCVGIARSWIAATESQVAVADDPAAVPSMRAKQCVFAMYGILAHAGSDELSADEAASLLRFAVTAHDGYVFESDASPPDGPAVFAALRTRCECVLASRVGALVAAARANGDVLTTALKSVQPLVPEQLSWTELRAPEGTCLTGCFEAVTPDGHLYSMDALTGLVLLDGSPPRSLPADVLTHPLYIRSFGNRDFEVGITGSGALRTVRPLAGCVYEFFVDATGRLSVKELQLKNNNAVATDTLELLDCTPEGVTEWGAELPIRLRKLYSHWLCRASNALFVRDIRLPLRQVSFIGLLGEAQVEDGDEGMDDSDGCVDAVVRCIRVPLHLRDCPASVLVELANEGGAQLVDVLQLWPSGAPVPALAKFEADSLTHWYRNSATSIFSVELPRYRLEFALLPGPDGGALVSKEYSGYSLARCQQLPDALHGLSQYLLLEPSETLLLQPPFNVPLLKVVVPSGTVMRDDESGAVQVVGDDAPGAERAPPWTFDAHSRFGELRAHSVPARLHLAALYAACDTGVPEARSGFTGAEMALSLVRRSFINRPPSAEEQERCDNVAALSRATPALHLACSHWGESARQLAFLHPEAPMAPRADDIDPVRLMDSVKAYAKFASSAGSYANRRRLLLPAEELRLMGKSAGQRPQRRAGVARTDKAVVNVAEPPVAASYVTDAEARLRKLVASQKTKARVFPLNADALASDKLGADMLGELRASWDAKQGLAQHALKERVTEPAALQELMQAELDAAATNRATAEQHLLNAVALEPAADAAEPLRRAAAAVRLRRASGALPPPSLPELALVALDPDIALAAISPLLALSAADVSCFTRGVLIWMQLCVLEDKLKRLTRMAAALLAAIENSDVDSAASLRADVVRELRGSRVYDVSAHPEWLAFELDGALQIRPAQHALASEVLAHAERGFAVPDQPGPVLQLNMGEVRLGSIRLRHYSSYAPPCRRHQGKTRVIVPMLVLCWARQRKHVRLNLLAQLLPEAYDHLHDHRTGGLLATPLFLLPFHRDVQVTKQRAETLIAHAEYARQAGGALLVTPESRASMHLKQHELRAAAARDPSEGESLHLAAADMLAHIEALPWRDVYDESDELLRVKFQLVYAVGSPGELPFLQERAAAVSALLRALRDNPDARNVLADERVAVVSPAPPGAFLTALRLLPGSAMDAALPKLHLALAAAVLSDPPYELRWLRRFAGCSREVLLAYVTDASRAADAIISPSAFASAAHHAAMLALRGFLAHGVLAHALRQRHRVDYGVAPLGPARRKRLAVPFRACDVPAQRAEFAHPDAALALTTVSYYFSGLSATEVLDAFVSLMTLGETEQEVRYGDWHAASAPGMTPTEAASVDNVRKLDLSNVLQRALLCRAYARCVPLIDFWLQFRVLPGETTQYPQRLRATSWHMRAAGAGASAGGFSGTNDQHRLLPLHVRQRALPDAELEATNGHMLALLLEKATYEAQAPPAAGEPAWQALLGFAVRHGAVALMDAGALLAGVDLAGAAAHALKLLQDTPSLGLQAVVYFDTASGHAGEWVLVDTAGGRWPKQRAPVAERDAFVIFDEARCRGADMRLRRDALAVLTLGPRMGKDKLMQAAGRLRQLDRGQSLLLTAQRDVHDAILAVAASPHAASQPSAGQEGSDDCVAASGSRRIGRKAALADGSPETALQGQPRRRLDKKVSVKVALAWVMANTMAASRAGLLEWSFNGLHYVSVNAAPDTALADEKLTLESFYSAAATPQDVGELVSLQATQASKLAGASDEMLAPLLQSYAHEVTARADAYGSGTRIAASSLDEECERELEQEEEQEQEIEVEVPHREPRNELDWNVAAVAAGGNAAQLRELAAGRLVTTLADAVAAHLRPAELTDISWHENAWLTTNFMRTLAPPEGAAADDEREDLSLYQRPVDALLWLSEGDCDVRALLLSDREAEAVLEAHWAAGGAGARPPQALLHHSYARCVRDPSLITPSGVGAAATVLPDALAVALQLLNGETTLGDELRKAAAAAVLSSKTARGSALRLPVMRGKAHLIARSQLEECCEEVEGGAAGGEVDAEMQDAYKLVEL